MEQLRPTLRTAWAIASQLTSAQRETLAKRLLREDAGPQVELVIVPLRHFSRAKSIRLDELLTNSNEGILTAKERRELTNLVDEYERNLIANTQALLRATQPELFSATGKLIASRAKHSVRRHRRRIE
jgi:hypothetical protein